MRGLACCRARPHALSRAAPNPRCSRGVATCYTDSERRMMLQHERRGPHARPSRQASECHGPRAREVQRHRARPPRCRRSGCALGACGGGFRRSSSAAGRESRGRAQGRRSNLAARRYIAYVRFRAGVHQRAAPLACQGHAIGAGPECRNARFANARVVAREAPARRPERGSAERRLRRPLVKDWRAPEPAPSSRPLEARSERQASRAQARVAAR